MSAPSIESIVSSKCPYCGVVSFWTDTYDDFELHRAHYEKSPIQFLPGIDVGAWRPGVEIRIKGRVGQITRKDLTEFRVFPQLCLGCRRLFVAHLSVRNVADVRHYEEVVRPVSPPKHDKDEVLPKWGMMAFGMSQFVDEVKAIRNPMVRGAVIRRVSASVEIRDASGKSVWDDVPAPPEPPQ
ncbi:MAG: hypothetical protein ACREB9_00205 [Thermoplasmata archaeon]